MVAVIPVFHVREALLHAIILKHLLHFAVRKPKIFCTVRIRNRKHIKIVQARKNTLSCNPQAACKHCKIQILIGFERLA